MPCSLRVQGCNPCPRGSAVCGSGRFSDSRISLLPRLPGCLRSQWPVRICGIRPRLQRRARLRFARSSLFVHEWNLNYGLDLRPYLKTGAGLSMPGGEDRQRPGKRQVGLHFPPLPCVVPRFPLIIVNAVKFCTLNAHGVVGGETVSFVIAEHYRVYYKILKEKTPRISLCREAAQGFPACFFHRRHGTQKSPVCHANRGFLCANSAPASTLWLTSC